MPKKNQGYLQEIQAGIVLKRLQMSHFSGKKYKNMDLLKGKSIETKSGSHTKNKIFNARVSVNTFFLHSAGFYLM